MKGLLFFLSLLLSAYSLDVEFWGSDGDRDRFIERLAEHDIHVEETESQQDLQLFGEWRTDALIIAGDTDKIDNVIDFVNAGHSVIIFLNDRSRTILDLVQELAIKPINTKYTDTTCEYRHPISGFVDKENPCGGYRFVPEENKHAVTYDLFVGPENKTFAIASQGDNDARIVIFGNSNFGIDDQETDNPTTFEHVIDLALWAFHKTGVLRARDLTYVRGEDGAINPPELTISENIDFSIVLEQYDEKKGEWVAYDADDVQLDFTMLVPRIRKTLKSCKNGTFALSFQLPDLFGVYQFIVDYHAYGYSPINTTHQVMVHPLRHDQHPRFVPSAYPFYTASILVALAFLALAIYISLSSPIFLSLPSEGKNKAKKAADPKAAPSQSKKNE